VRLTTAICAAGALLAAGLPALAQAPDPYEVFLPNARAAALPLSHFAGSGAPQHAVRRRQLTQAAAAGVPTALLQAAQLAAAPAGARVVQTQDDGTVIVIVSGGTGSNSFVQPAGDLNADGTRDVLEVRYGRAKNGRLAVLTAVRSGDSGTVLWHRTDVLASGHFVFPIPTSVGRTGRPGVVMLEVGAEKRGDSSLEVTDKLTALDGAGRRLWQHADSGTVSFSNGFSGHHEPSFNGFLQSGPGAKSGLLTIADYGDDGSGTMHATVAYYRVDGATGRVSRDGASVTSSDSFPVSLCFPDVSGDRREDYVVVVGGTAPRLEARRGDTGAPVWANTALSLQPGSYAEPIGRVMGGRVEDLAVLSPPPPDKIPEVGTPVADVSDPTRPADGQVSLVRGDTGAKVWTQAGDGTFGVVRAGSARVPAVGVTTEQTTSDANGTTETLHLQAYDVGGSKLYDTSYTVQAPADRSQGTFSFGFAAAFAGADLQRDGALDGTAWLIAFDGENRRERTVLFDGASGAAVPGGHELLGGSVTGAGDDLVDVTPGASITVTARSGRDRHALFTRRLTPRSKTDYASAYGERILGRCASLIVQAAGTSTSYVALLAPTGAVRWSLEHASDDLTAKPATVGPARRSTVCA
jgi:hypothetical protein